MKKLFIYLITLVTLLSPLFVMAVDTPTTDTTPQLQKAFSDVDQSHSNFVAIQFLKDKGIITGYADGSFQPAKLVNRAEALKILLEGNKVQTAVPNVSSFPDVKLTDWFVKYVETAKTSGIIKGNPDGTYAPSRNVSRAEFLKMLLILNSFIPDKWSGQKMFNDVPKDAWYAPYLNYAGQAGLLTKDDKNNLYPARELTRGDVAEIMYLMTVIRNDKDTQFLIDQTEAQMSQIEIYIGVYNLNAAKRASSLSVDFSQEALLNMPSDKVVLAAAKLAKAYDFLINSFIAALNKDYTSSKNWADQAVAKATEAWEVNHDIQAIAKHIKDRAAEIVAQYPKT